MTHYEILDYTLGDFPELERELTFYNKITHRSNPKYFYDGFAKTLYVPRGYDEAKLVSWNGKPVTPVDDYNYYERADFQMVLPPKNEEQKLAIDYLVGSGVYESTRNVSQKILLMPPSRGKTYCAISAIQKLRMRALIIVRTKSLKEQWIERIKSYTNIHSKMVVDISSSEILKRYLYGECKLNYSHMIFVVTRSLLMSFCKTYGMLSLNDAFKTLAIGIKVIDEAHQEYERTLYVDYFTNVRKTFYLTATFAQSDYYNNLIFQRVFNLTQKLQFKVTDRHIVYVAILYNSHPNALIREQVMMKDKFDRFKYIDYQIDAGIMVDAVTDCIHRYLKQEGQRGKTLILSSKHSSCDYFKDLAESLVGDTHTVCAFYTGNKVENYKAYDIISATPQMLGTGEDIPYLRFLFNTEPGRSLPNLDQFSGRLRPYEDEDGKAFTMYIEFVDKGFSKVYSWYKTRKKLMDKKAVKCYELTR